MSSRLHGFAGALAVSSVSAVIASAFVTPTSAAYFADVETIRASAEAGTWDVAADECADDERPAGQLCIARTPAAMDEPQDSKRVTDEAPRSEPAAEAEPLAAQPQSAPEPEPQSETQPEPEPQPVPEPETGSIPDPAAPPALPEAPRRSEAEPVEDASTVTGLAG